MKGVTFRQLRVFVEASNHLSFARTAEHLHLTPPAISLQIKELESAVGHPLFDRAGRSVALTTVGEYFLVYARRLLATLKEADDAMARFSRLEAGALSVGMVSTAIYFVPQLLSRFREEHPGVDIRFSVAQNRAQMHALLGANEIDVAIMGRAPQELNTRSESFAAHPFVFVCPPDHPLLAVGDPPLEALEPYTFLVRESESGTRNAMQQFFTERSFHPRSRLEMASNETIKQAVCAGLGISFLSLHSLGLELSTGAMKILHVPDSPVIRVWNIVHMQSRILSPAAEAFRYFMIEHGEAYLAGQDAIYLNEKQSR